MPLSKSSKEAAARGAGAVGCSIRVASRLTSIQPDTLRVWERRYGFPLPERREGGSRVYSDGDIETLHLIARALEVGYRPGEVVGKAPDELRRILATSAAAGAGAARASSTPTVDSIARAVVKDDLVGLRAELRQAATLFGPMRFVVEIAHPAAVRVGALWAEGKLEIRQEHVFCECLSAQLHIMLSAYDDAASGPLVVLATLPHEAHALSLEMVALYLAVHQVAPRLVGANTPAEQIVRAARAFGAVAVGVCVMPSSDLVAAARDLGSIRTELPRRVHVWVGGAAAADLRPQAGLTTVRDWADLDAAITALDRAPRP